MQETSLACPGIAEEEGEEEEEELANMAHHRCAWIYRHSESYIAAGRKMPASTGQYGSQSGNITTRYSNA